MGFEQRDDRLVGQARTRRLGARRVESAGDQRLQDVGALPPDAEADQPVAVRTRIGTLGQDKAHDVEVPGGNRVVQHRRTDVGIVLGLLGADQVRIRGQAVSNSGEVA